MARSGVKGSIKGALVILALAYFVDWLAVVTWTVFFFESVLGISHKCFDRNPLLSSLLIRAEDRDLNRNIKIPATLMAEIDAKDYSFDGLRILSNDWREPVVVRGLFSSSEAIRKWNHSEYLISEVFGSNDTSVIQNGTLDYTYRTQICGNPPHEFSKEQPFDESLRRIESGTSAETIVFPPASRSKRFRNAALETAWNRLINHELDLPRLGGTFTDGVTTTALTQMFLGHGAPENSSRPIVGTGWHCDICNNFIVQVSGVKRWIMVDPKYSLYMRPAMTTGKTAIAGGWDTNINYIPHYVVDLHPGDFLYNPEWYWHSIVNLPVAPYSFGVVSRQCHMKRNIRSNAIFTSVIIANHALAGIYDPEARQRVWSALVGSSLMKPEDSVVVPKDRESGGYT